jgi:ABC-type uncharacterized transport system involved in gliding motility auxiliary subunit
MTSNNTRFGRIGLVTLAALFIMAVFLSNIMFSGFRLDLTENQLFTLSEGTEKILSSIEEPINLYFFYSDRSTENIPQLRTYAGRVQETLREFVEKSNGQLRLTVIDPLPFSDDEDRANEFGLQGITLPNASDAIYMGIAASNSIGDEEIIAFLDPSKENFLEYDLAKLVHNLANAERKVIGLMTDLPITAGFDLQTQQMRQPWLIISEIRQLFELRTLSTTASSIDEDIDVLMIVHPKGLSEATLYAIDQYILRGGRALIAVDPFAEADIPISDPNNPASAMMADRSSDLNRLINTWGLNVDTQEVVGDDRFALSVTGFGAQPVRHVALIGVDERGIDTDDVITSGVRNLNFGYTGYISAEENAVVTLAPLVQSSDVAGVIKTSALAMIRDPDTLRDGFAPTGNRFILAGRIGGKVASAFPDGPPAGTTTEEGDQLTEAVESINVILIADTDLLTDRLWAQVQNFFGQPISTAFAGNGNFIVNALDNLTGSSDLISIRSRDTYTRPFTRVQDLRGEAESQYRITEQALELQLQETEAKLTELQASREDSSNLILSPEQERALETFQEERLRIRKELRQVRRNLDEDIENLGTRLKIFNIGAMPLLISVISLGLLFWRRQRRSGAKP